MAGRKKKREARIETLDDDFNICESIATSYGTSSVIPSGNVRVTFSSGASFDLYVVSEDKLFISGRSRDDYTDRLVFEGAGNEGVDFVISAQSKKDRR